MTPTTKRGRGRPIGSGRKDDAPVLRRVADLIVATPSLKATAAMKVVLGSDDPSVIRRLQGKWRIGKNHYLAQASERRAIVSAPPRRSGGHVPPQTARQIGEAHRLMQNALGLARPAAVQAALDDPALRAAREMMNSPRMIAAQEAARRYRESPAIQAIEHFQNSPTMRAMRELNESPTMRAAREISVEIQKVTRMLGGGF